MTSKEWDEMVARVAGVEAEIKRDRNAETLNRLEWQACLVLSEGSTAPCHVNPETLLEIVQRIRDLEKRTLELLKEAGRLK